VHLVAHDQLLRELLGLVGVGAGVVARDELDLHARRQLLLVLLDVQAHRALHVGPEVAVQAGVAGDEADLDGLRVAGDRHDGEREHEQQPHDLHGVPPP
jgi:hypothetical protein